MNINKMGCEYNSEEVEKRNDEMKWNEAEQKIGLQIWENEVGLKKLSLGQLVQLKEKFTSEMDEWEEGSPARNFFEKKISLVNEQEERLKQKN